MSIDTHVGQRIGEYEIQQLIGRGSLSVVYLAEHTRLKRQVALKLFSAELAQDGEVIDPSSMDWERLAPLDHPNIIPVLEAGEASGLPFIAMKYVVGRSLADMIRQEGALDPEEALDILDDVASALEFAHERGIVHRDVRPHNILIASDADPAWADRTYLCDFAIMKDAAPWRAAQTVGTRAYLAPEQLRGDPVDGRTDVYSLGCVLFETLTGSPPFASEGADGLTFAHLAKRPPSVHERRPDLPAGIDSVLEKALAKGQEDRFEKPSDLLASARDSLTHRTLELPRAGASVIVLDDLEAKSPSNEALTAPMLTLDTVPQVHADAAPASPPSGGNGAVLALPKRSVDTRMALDDATPDLAPSSIDRAAPHRMLVLGALVAMLALVGGAAVALFRDDVDVRAGSPGTSDGVEAGTVPNEPPETGSAEAPAVVEPSIAPVAAPRDVEVAFASGERVRIEWKVPKTGSPPVRFVVFRDDERVTSTTRPVFRDRDVAPGQRHEYRIIAVGEDRSKARSTRVVATVPSVQEPSEPPTTDVVSGEAPPPPPDPCDGIVVGDDCI
jgi:serine/threonine protein kinase